MTMIKKIILWSIVFLLVIIVVGAFPSFASVSAVIIAVLIAPINKWQDFLCKHITGKIKTILLIILTIIMFFTFPAADTPSTEGNSPSLPIAPATIATPAPTTIPTTTPSAAPTTGATTNPTTTSTVETISVPASAATTAPTTKPTTAPTTKPTTVPTIKPTTTPTTKATVQPTAAPTTAPTKPAETVHAHSWKEATCTDPKTCTSCGSTEGQANGHTWKEATYTTPKTCTTCHTTDGSALEKPGKENYHGHVYTGGSSSTKYHYEEKCPGKNSHEITWEEVDRKNLGPCGTCVLK